MTTDGKIKYILGKLIGTSPENEAWRTIDAINVSSPVVAQRLAAISRIVLRDPQARMLLTDEEMDLVREWQDEQ